MDSYLNINYEIDLIIMIMTTKPPPRCGAETTVLQNFALLGKAFVPQLFDGNQINCFYSCIQTYTKAIFS